ncbi:MAG: serine/threonine-protein kinase PknK [Deltaproteobacteria bacterium]|nr:serine/threonine-protein kinase PknK [Deltaproteobacteria bacterium]
MTEEQLISSDIDRYRLIKILGRGGMATVYEVEDSLNGERLALKRMERENNDETARLEKFFKREFHSLAHFAHPCVVQVKEFGRDKQGRPFYTMELLLENDLGKLSPLPYMETCRLLADICSVLSFLHSRRLVHRDVTPRNIRLSQDGKAKLIDFGTLMVVGPPKQLAGTPPFCAPENLTGEDIDHRVDLYSLGVVLYLMLTGRYPYVARKFADLRDAWRSPPHPPSHYAKDIPETLDNLVLALLQLDRSMRPSSAGEVMERLCAIANVDIREQLIVPKAYFTTPTMVGRNEPLLRIRKSLVRALRSRGSAILVTGDSGMGRSRILSASVLEAKLLGVPVIRLDAADAIHGAFSTARVMLQRLLEIIPAPELSVPSDRLRLLTKLVPQFKTHGDSEEAFKTRVDNRRSEPPPIADLAANRSQLQSALLDLFSSVADRQKLLLAVDDFHRLDEPSAALIALLVEHCCHRGLVLIATLNHEALVEPSDAVQFISKLSSRIELSGLSAEESHVLLGSIFGNVPNLRMLADHLHRISCGVPSVIMQLAQHLLDQGSVKYEAGTWILPARISDDGLPRSLSEAVAHKVARLRYQSLSVLKALALVPERSPSQEELLELCDIEHMGELLEALEELIIDNLVSVYQGYVSLTDKSMVYMLRTRMDNATTKKLHLKWALLLERRPDHQELLAVDHFVRASEYSRAMDLAVSVAPKTNEIPMERISVLLRELPSDWMKLGRVLRDYCERSGRPKRDLYEMMDLFVASNTITATAIPDEMFDLLQQASRDCGLDIYDQLDDSIPPADRLRIAIEQAQQRYDATPDHERFAPPIEAMACLARTSMQCIGILCTGYDWLLSDRMPSLAPLSPLSPAIELVAGICEVTRDMTIGRHHRVRQRFIAFLDRLNQPDRAGFDELHHRYIRLFIQCGLVDVDLQYAVPSALEMVGEIRTDPLFEGFACRLSMLCALTSGDASLAENYRYEAELLRIKNGPPIILERRNVVPECACYAFVGDLARLKQNLPEIESRARTGAGWQAVLHWAQGLYRQLRGEHERAIEEFSSGLAVAPAAENGMYLYLATGFIESLTAIDRIAEACKHGEQFLSVAEAADLGPLAHLLIQAVARAHGENKEYDRARELADLAVVRLEDFGAGGMVMGGAYETRARVALAEADEEAFRTYAEKCAEFYKPGRQPMLASRYAALMSGIEQPKPSTRPSIDDFDSAVTQQFRRTTSVNRAIKDKRMEIALKTVIDSTPAVGGHLFTLRPTGPIQEASYGQHETPSDFTDQIAMFLSAELDASDEVTVTLADKAAVMAPFCWTAADGGVFFPSLLTHSTQSGVKINGVIVLRSRDANPVYAPNYLCSAISAALQESGDVVTMLAAT